MLRTKNIKRKGKFTAIPKAMRKEAHRDECQVCKLPYSVINGSDGEWLIYCEHLDHLIPRRFLNEHGIFEHAQANIYSVCQFCHGKKKGFEDRLFHGDLLSYLQGLRSIGYPVERVVAFALSVGLKEFGRLNV
jgi:5-methylcytosine-specific restriction endonuclease McrA